MAYDITYHPVSTSDIQRFVLNILDVPEVESYRPLLVELTTEAEDQEFIETGIYARFTDFRKKIDDNKGNTKSTTGFATAALAGYLHPYWYCRNGALSFLCENEPEFASFLHFDWSFLPEQQQQYVVDAFGPLKDHYQAGVFVPFEKLPQLRLALSDSMYNDAVSEHIGHRNFDVLMAAIDYCIANELGLLEATDIFVPLSGETSTYHKNLRAPYLKNIDDFSNARKLQLNPKTYDEFETTLNSNRKALQDGIVDIQIQKEWIEKFDKATYQFLLKYGKSAKIEIARSNTTPPDVLEMLAFDRSVTDYIGEEATCYDHVLAQQVAENPATPSHLLEKIHRAFPEETSLHAGLARHHNAPARLLERLARHPNALVRSVVIANPNSTAEILHELRNDTVKENRVSALKQIIRKKKMPLWFKILFFPIVLVAAVIATPFILPRQYFKK